MSQKPKGMTRKERTHDKIKNMQQKNPQERMQSNTEKYHKKRNISKTTQKNRKQNRPHPKRKI